MNRTTANAINLSESIADEAWKSFGFPTRVHVHALTGFTLIV